MRCHYDNVLVTGSSSSSTRRNEHKSSSSSRQYASLSIDEHDDEHIVESSFGIPLNEQEQQGGFRFSQRAISMTAVALAILILSLGGYISHAMAKKRFNNINPSEQSGTVLPPPFDLYLLVAFYMPQWCFRHQTEGDDDDKNSNRKNMSGV
jgi:hypothetical protein